MRNPEQTTITAIELAGLIARRMCLDMIRIYLVTTTYICEIA